MKCFGYSLYLFLLVFYKKDTSYSLIPNRSSIIDNRSFLSRPAPQAGRSEPARGQEDDG